MCKFRERFRHIITFRDFQENCLITFLEFDSELGFSWIWKTSLGVNIIWLTAVLVIMRTPVGDVNIFIEIRNVHCV